MQFFAIKNIVAKLTAKGHFFSRATLKLVERVLKRCQIYFTLINPNKILLKQVLAPAALVTITAPFKIRLYNSKQMCFIIRSLYEVNQAIITWS